MFDEKDLEKLRKYRSPILFGAGVIIGIILVLVF